jgi:hypothetical protein
MRVWQKTDGATINEIVIASSIRAGVAMALPPASSRCIGDPP